MNETLKTIHSLRSNHQYSEKEIPQEDLDTILKAAVRAANASGRQSYSIVVVKEREAIRNMLGYDSKTALVFCIDYNRLKDTAVHLGQQYPIDGIREFISGSTDAALAAQTAAIAAQSLGIASLFTNIIHRGDMDRVYDQLELPKRHCFPLVALILGYSDEHPTHLRGRLQGKGVIHFDKYRKLTGDELDELVKEHDDPDKHLYLNTDWKQQGFAHYLEWFYKVWTTRDKRPPEARTKPFYEILQRAEFIDSSRLHADTKT